MPQLILKIVLFISSILSVNAVFALPLASIINSDIQHVDTVEHNQSIPCLKLNESSDKKLINAVSACELCKSYIGIINIVDAFNLYKGSLSFAKTRNVQQQYQIQKMSFLHTFVQHHQQFHQNLFQIEKPLPH